MVHLCHPERSEGPWFSRGSAENKNGELAAEAVLQVMTELNPLLDEALQVSLTEYLSEDKGNP